MRIVTINMNGIRSASNRGFFAWLARQEADVVCLQEIKAHEVHISDEMRAPEGLYGYFQPAAKPGYAGVGLYGRRLPDAVSSGLGWPDMDAEGRFLRADFGNLSVISLYMPSGSSSPERQAVKFSFLERFLPVLVELAQCGREIIICGDWNMAHKEIDLKNWRSNQKNPGFLPQERAWLSRVFDEIGMVDVFRQVDQRAEQYTWWSNRGQAWAKNVGWRIDHQIATPGIARLARAVSIYKDERFSDHAPLTIDYDYSF
jgi:exodeoxyribonuclease III